MRTKVSCRSILAIFIFIVYFVFCDTAFAAKLYWADGGSSKIQRAGLNGSSQEDLVTSGLTTNMFSLRLDERVGQNMMYWAENSTQKIRKANIAVGATPEDFLTTADGFVGAQFMDLDLINNQIYWADFSGGRIQRANLTGAPTITDVITGLATDALFGLSLDISGVNQGSIYWVERTFGGSAVINRIRRAELADLSTFHDVIREANTAGNVIFPQGIRVSDGFIYWANSNAIRRTDKNGIDQITTDSASFDTIVTIPGGQGAREMAFFGGQIFWTQNDGGGAGSIRSADANTIFSSNVTTTIVSGLVSPFGLDISPIPELPPGAFPALGFAMSGLLLWYRKKHL